MPVDQSIKTDGNGIAVLIGTVNKYKLLVP